MTSHSKPGFLTLILLAAGLVALAGCGRDSAGPSAPAAGGTTSADVEQAEVAAALSESPEALEDGTFETEDEWTTTAASGSRIDPLEAIRPLKWWRTIRGVERSFEFAFADTDSVGRPTRVVVTIHKRLHGSFNILAGNAVAASDTGGGRDSLQLVRKPLVDHWVRRVLLHRVRCAGDDRVRWRIAAVSGVEVTSRAAKTDILSLRVQTATEDTTIYRPLAFWHLPRIVRVHPGEEVTLTVTTLTNDDVVVLLARGGRFRFHNNGDNTYTGRWRAPDDRGLRHVGINALSHGTLFDDTEPYDSNAWILPYAVRGWAVDEYLPRL